MRKCVKAALPVLLAMVCAVAVADPTTFLQDGNGYWWDFNANGSVDDGRGPTQPADSVDSFDAAVRLAIDGVPFPDSSQAMELAGRMLATGPVSMSGLNVTRRAYVPGTPGQGWACFIEYLENPTGAGITVTLRIFGNLGSDGATAATASSSGDAVWTLEDRWVASDDANNGGGDPSLSFNYWGLGTTVTPSAVFLPASQEDYYTDFPGVPVPAGATVLFMHFCSQNANNAAAAAAAQYLDALPVAALAGLNAANYGPVLNWDLSDDLGVSPHAILLFSGQHGGPFGPASQDYTLTNRGSVAIDWSASGPAWIDLTPASATEAGGLLGPGNSLPVTVAVNAAAQSFTPGEYTEAVMFTNLTNSVDTARSVRVTVEERLEVAEEEGLTQEGFQGGPFTPGQRTYTLRNIGTPESLQWSVTVPAWLTATPANYIAAGGELAPGASVVVTIAPDAFIAGQLTPGTYSGDLSFRNETFGTTHWRDMAITVKERLSVTAPGMFISRGRYSPPSNGPFVPAAFAYTVTNISPAAIQCSVPAAVKPDWLSYSGFTSGTIAPGQSVQTVATVNANAATKAAGDYAGIVRFQNDSYSTYADEDVVLRVMDVAYVDAAAPPGGDGLTWGTAVNTINEGIAVATAGPETRWVWVADGAYVETLAMPDGVEVYGGFAGGETALDERDPEGESIASIDGGASGSVVSFGVVSFAGVDGFTITGGLADTAGGTITYPGGGGVRCDGSDNTNFISKCIICNNRAEKRGGGIYCLNGAAPSILDCTIVGNETLDAPGRDFGGGICCWQSDPTITGGYICNNEGRHGGGLGCIESSPIVTDVIITGNVAASSEINPANGEPVGSGGGGIFAHNDANPTLTNCIISGNYTQNWSGGALFCQGQSKPILTNCTISNNSSRFTTGYNLHGGIVVNTGSAPVLVNCIVEGTRDYAVYEENPYQSLPENEAFVFVSNCLFVDNAGADFHDFHDNVGTDYTGGDVLDANVDTAENNVAGNPRAQFLAGNTGVWSAAPVYDPNTHLTTLTTSGDPFSGLDLRGAIINPDTAQPRQALIIANTDNTVSVYGDITASEKGVPGYAESGDPFAVLDHHLEGYSPCVNVGDNTAPLLPAQDLGGNPRVRYGVVDLGVYECGIPAVSRVDHISPVGAEVVSNADTVDFEVIFTRAIDELELSDLVLIGLDGQTDASILSITGSGYHWTVTVDTGSGNGALDLALMDTDGSIVDILGYSPVPDYSSGTGYYIDYLAILVQPEGAHKAPGESHTFFVAAHNGTGQLHYHWKQGGVTVPGAADDPNLTIPHLEFSHAGVYTCEVSDDYTTVVSWGAELVVEYPVPTAGLVMLSMLAGVIALAGTAALRKRVRLNR